MNRHYMHDIRRTQHGDFARLRPIALACVLFWCLVWLACTRVEAQEACPPTVDCISLVYPTTWSSGIVMSPGDWIGAEIEYFAGPDWKLLTRLTYPETKYRREGVSGTNQYRARVLGRTGGTSPYIGPIVSVKGEVPKPKTLVVVEPNVYNTGTFDPVAWLVKRNKFYGLAPLGTPCDATRPAVGSYYRIPASAVAWEKANAKTPNPMAKCELR